MLQRWLGCIRVRCSVASRLRIFHMQSAQDFTDAAQQLILVLEDATAVMAGLISASSIGTNEWKSAVSAQQEAFVELHLHLSQAAA